VILFLQMGVRPLEYRFFVHHQPHTLLLRVSREPGRVSQIERVVLDSGIPLRGLRLRAAEGDGPDRLDVALGTASESAIVHLLERLGQLEGVGSVTYRRTSRRFSFNGEQEITNDDRYSSSLSSPNDEKS
jgi:hypothetical protein